MSDEEDFGWVDKLKVTELKKELKTRRESLSGRKAELAKRLKDRLKSDVEEAKKEEAEAAGEEIKEVIPEGSEEPEDEPGDKMEVEKSEAQEKEVESTEPAAAAPTPDEKESSGGAEEEKKSKDVAEPPGQPDTQDPKEKQDPPPESGKKQADAKAEDAAEVEVDDILGEDDMDDMAFDLEPTIRGKRKKSRGGKSEEVKEAKSTEVKADDEAPAPEGDEGRGPSDDTEKMQDQGEESNVMETKQDDGGAAAVSGGSDGKRGPEAKKRKLETEGQTPTEGGSSSGMEGVVKRKRVPIPVPGAKPTEAQPPSSAAQDSRDAAAPYKPGQRAQPPSTLTSQPSGPPVPQIVSRALRINNFVRPFNDKACREMLEQHGEIEDMWMPSIKTHCYVLYKNDEQAMKAFKATYNLEWPRGGRKLIPYVVAVAEAQREIQRGRMRGGSFGGTGEFQGVSNAGYARSNSVSSMGPEMRMERHPSGSAYPQFPQARRPVNRAVTLEDLFFKTHTKPPLYYLPLTDEQAAAKKKQDAQKEIRRDDGAENNCSTRQEAQ